MTNSEVKVNAGDTAPIKNVASCLGLIRQLQNRNPLQPNLGVFAGFSGYGKSVAALYSQNKTGAAYVEVSDTWNRKKLMSSILTELGQYAPRGTLSDMEDEIIGRLARQPTRPLIIDESDKLVDKNLIELVRMIAKKSNVPVLLIGEENFPVKLERAGDRFRDLVLVMGYAQACDLDDTKTLARTFYPQIRMTEELLEEARRRAEGRVRRIGNTLHAIAAFASARGWEEISLDQFTGRYSEGKLPSRREAA